MKRRGFLGMLAGGAVAGPSVAKNAVAQISPILGSSTVMSQMPEIGMGIGGYGSPIPSGGVLSTFDRITKLTNLISGKEAEEEDPYWSGRYRETQIEQNINALGSVSPVCKVRMMLAAHENVERERQKKYWLRELIELRKM